MPKLYSPTSFPPADFQQVVLLPDNMMIRFPLPIFFFLCWLCSSLPAQTSPHRPGEFLVSLTETGNAAALARHLAPGASAEKVSNLLNIWLLRADLPEQEALSWLRRQPEVRMAQFNHLLENRALPNDPLFPQQWQLRNDGSNGAVFDADVDAEQAWEISTGGLTPAGDTIVIAVIDGGIQNSHPDLAPNLWHNWAEIPNNDIDDDDNGYTDDFKGWNVFAESDDIEGNGTTHGTPVSAIVGARGNNNLGVTGVNWTTKIMFIAASGTEAQVLAAYDYVLQARKRYNLSWGNHGAFVVAVNCSWGVNYGQPSEAPLWCEAFDQLGAAGIIGVAATANEPVNVDVVGDLPTACPSNFLISVTSLNSSDQKAANAAWGTQHVDLGAFGQDVFTASAGNGYGVFTGTSFASPQVAGAVGLLYSAPCPNLIALAKTNPASAAYWAKSLILENVTPNPSLNGITLTDGRLNLYKTLQTYQNQCSSCPAPFALKIEALNDTSAMLLWTRPPTADSVNLRWRLLGMGPWMTIASVADTFFLSGLAVCTAYEFEMQSVCPQSEQSAWSQPFIFETKGCCTAPGSVWLEINTVDSIKIAWEATGYNNSYRLRIRKAGSFPWTLCEADSSFWAFDDISPCTDYELQVQARCEDSFTEFSPLFTFKTKGCGACNELEYCGVKAEDATEEWIASVQIGSWLHPSGPGGNGYQNFSADLVELPELIAGYEFPIQITPGFSGAVTKEYYRMFVDYNQDGDFDDDDELVFDPGFALEGVAEGLIHAPVSLVPGIARVRVMMKFTTANDTPPAACTNFSFGQVEDYCVQLRTDSALTAIPVQEANWSLRIYPQPAGEWVALEFPEAAYRGELMIEVRDMTGRVVMTRLEPTFRQDKIILDSSLWPSGVYALQVRYAGKMFCGKLLKS